MNLYKYQKRTSSPAKKWAIIILIFILPYGIIYFSGLAEWTGRTFASCLFVSILNPSIFWWSLHPESEVIGKQGELRRPNHRNGMGRAEKFIRALGTLFGIFFFFCFTQPLMMDVYSLLTGKSPIEVHGRVKDNDTYFGTWFLKQSILLEGDTASNGSYTLLYSMEPRINRGENVNLLVLPHSRIVVSVQK